MAWYTLLFIGIFGLFFAKIILSWCVGDIDMDVDFDGVDDFDSSSAFSFKGLLHFLMGASSYLFLRASVTNIEKINNVAQFGIVDYVFATICGFILMLILYFGYKVALKANQKTLDPQDLINNSRGIIYLNLGNNQYSVEAHTSAGTTNVTAYYEGDDLKPGDEIYLRKEDSKIFIKHITE